MSETFESTLVGKRVLIETVSGKSYRGTIKNFDSDGVVLEHHNGDVLVYRAAIVSIQESSAGGDTAPPFA